MMAQGPWLPLFAAALTYLIFRGAGIPVVAPELTGSIVFWISTLFQLLLVVAISATMVVAVNWEPASYTGKRRRTMKEVSLLIVREILAAKRLILEFSLLLITSVMLFVDAQFLAEMVADRVFGYKGAVVGCNVRA